jgi:hypothetical protein
MTKKIDREKSYFRETVRNERLYDQSKEIRRQIREHNLPIIREVGQALAALPWKAERRWEMALPELWCNQARLDGRAAHRFRLRFQVENYHPLLRWQVAVYDRRAGKLASDREWFLENSWYDSHFFRVSSSSGTSLGYEGNGFGQALLSLSNEFVEAVLHHLELWPRPALGKLDGRKVYAVIYDQSESGVSSLNPRDIKAIRDGKGGWTETFRDGWTSDLTRRLLPNYLPWRSEQRDQLVSQGWLPGVENEKNSFLAPLDFRAYATMPIEDFLDQNR